MPSSVVDIKRIKNADKRSIFAVYGYIHKYNPLFLDPIIDIILCFYYLADEWDAECIGSNLELIDGKTVKRDSGFGCGSAFLTNTVSDGIFSWKFKIIEDSNELNFGIYKLKAGPPSNIQGRRFFGQPNSGYTMDVADPSGKAILMDPTKKGCAPLRPYCNSCNIGDVVEMILDCDECTLSFKINDIDYGVAFDNIEKTEYRAAIFMYTYGKNGCIELLQ